MLATDERLLVVTSGERDRRATERIESIAFSEVAGVTVETVDDEEPSMGGIVAGALGALLGLTFVGLSLDQSGLLGLAVGAIGALVFLGGIILLLQAYDTEEGHLDLRVFSTAGKAGRSYRLPRTESSRDFATSIAEHSVGSRL